MYEKLDWGEIVKTARADWRGALGFVVFTIAILLA